MAGLEFVVATPDVESLSFDSVAVDFRGTDRGGQDGAETVTIEDLPEWEWTKGAAIEQPLAESDLASIRSVVSGLRSAFALKDADAMLDLMNAKLIDYAKSTGDLAKEREFAAMWLGQVMMDSGNKLQDIDLHDLKVVRVNDRVMRVLTADDQDPLTTTELDLDGQSGTFRLPIYMSKIAGQWVIAR